MSLTNTDLHKIEEIFDRKIDKKLSNHPTNEVFQMMMVEIDERFNKIDKKLEKLNKIDKIDGIEERLERLEGKMEKIDRMDDKLDAIIYDMQSYRQEQDVTAHRVSEVDDRLTKVEELHVTELNLSI